MVLLMNHTSLSSLHFPSQENCSCPRMSFHGQGIISSFHSQDITKSIVSPPTSNHDAKAYPPAMLAASHPKSRTKRCFSFEHPRCLMPKISVSDMGSCEGDVLSEPSALLTTFAFSLVPVACISTIDPELLTCGPGTLTYIPCATDAEGLSSLRLLHRLFGRSHVTCPLTPQKCVLTASLPIDKCSLAILRIRTRKVLPV
jgi:hypothetical protein